MARNGLNSVDLARPVQVSTTDAVTTVDDTEGGTTLATAATNRRFLLIINQGLVDVWIKLDGTEPAVDDGIKLAPTRGLLFDVVVPQGEVLGICDTGLTADVCVVVG